MPRRGRGAGRKPAPLEQSGERAGKEQADEKTQGRYAPLRRRGGHFHGQAQEHGLPGIEHLLRKVGPGVGAEPGQRTPEIILLPEARQLRRDGGARLLQAREQPQGRRQGAILGEHRGEPQTRAGDSLHIGLHFGTDMPLLDFIRQARGHVVDALEQALGFGAGHGHGFQHQVEIADGGGDAAAHGLHGIGVALEGIGKDEQAAPLFLKRLELARKILRLGAETVAELERGLAHLVEHGALSGPHGLPGGVSRWLGGSGRRRVLRGAACLSGSMRGAGGSRAFRRRLAARRFPGSGSGHPAGGGRNGRRSAGQQKAAQDKGGRQQGAKQRGQAGQRAPRPPDVEQGRSGHGRR